MHVFIMREDIWGHFFCSCKHLKLGEEHSCLQKFPLHKTLGSEKTIGWDENYLQDFNDLHSLSNIEY